MSEDCVVESNRYLGQTPENPYLRIYYDGKWMDVPLPDVVAKASEDTSFAPEAVASDRIFIVQDANGDEGYSCRLYYVMLNDETPELTYCTTFGSESYFEIKEETESTESSKENDWIDLDMTVFDTEEYFIKVTGAGLDKKEKDTYKITMYCENKTSDKELHFTLQDGAINGMTVFLAAGITLGKEESKEHTIYITKSQAQYAGISDVYTIDEYTDISFLIYDTWDKNVQNIVHIYPKGEEYATSYVRENQPTDEILIDNEYVTVTIIGYESNSIANDTVKLLIENKSDTIIAWARIGIPTINGIEAKQYREENGFRDHLVPASVKNRVLPKSYAYASLDLRSAFLEENQVTNIESWEMIFQIWYGKTWDEELINETVTITP